MKIRVLAASLGLFCMIGLAAISAMPERSVLAGSEEPEQSSKSAQGGMRAKTKSKTEVAVFGAGCFWSTEAIFERIPGVKSVVSGYSGGTVPNPDYETVCTGQTGHAESVRIEYDPAVISYEKLLSIFWKVHDPTTWNRQGDDFGPQYRSIIFYVNEAQKKAAQETYKALTDKKVFRDPIVTELVPLRMFYRAEDYHQDYFRTQRYSDYSLGYIVPKLRKLKLMK